MRARRRRPSPHFSRLEGIPLGRAAARIVAWFRGALDSDPCGCRLAPTAELFRTRLARVEPLEERRLLAFVFIDDIEVPAGTPQVEVPILIAPDSPSEQIFFMNISFSAGDPGDVIFIPFTGTEFDGTIWENSGTFFGIPDTPGVYGVRGTADAGSGGPVTPDGLVITYTLNTAGLPPGAYDLDPNFNSESDADIQLIFANGTLTINGPPTADADGPYEIFEREDLILDASGSTDPDMDIVEYAWDLDNDGQFNDHVVAGPISTVAWPVLEALNLPLGFAQPIQLRVTDQLDNTSFDQTTLAINVSEPIPDIAEIVPSTDVACNVAQTFDGQNSSHTGNRNIALYEWDFDYDDVTFVPDASGPVVMHTYLVFGDHTTALRVTDDDPIEPQSEIGLAFTTTDFSNFPPTANAGGSYTSTIVDGTPQPIILDGTASSDANSPCDSIVQYEWDTDLDGLFGADDVDGVNGNASLPEPVGATVTFADPSWFPGEVRPISLRVTDTFGSQDTADSTVTVTLPPTPPTADADGPYGIAPGDDVTLDGSGSFDPNDCCGDAIVEYAWDLDNDGVYGETQNGQTEPVTTNEAVTVPNSVLTAFNLEQFGVPFTIRLRVTDSVGMTGEDTTTLTIFDDQPIASFTANPNPAACNQIVTFDASGSSHPFPSRSIVAWDWDFDDDGQFDDASGETVQHAFGMFGTFPVRLRVTDDTLLARTDVAEMVVSVNLGNNPPLANPGGPYVLDLGGSLLLDATGSSDPDAACGDSIVSYEWDIDDDGTFDLSSATPTLLVPAPALAGLLVADPQSGMPTNILTLRVVDELGQPSTAITTLTLYDNRPTAVIETFPDPPNIAVNEQVFFSGAGSTHGHPNHQITTYFWDFDASDGVNLDPTSGGFSPDAMGQTVPISFPNSGAFTVTLNVLDDNVPQRQDAATVVVTVIGAAPVLEAGGPYSVGEGADITLNGACIPSTSPQCAGNTYEWDFDGDGLADATGLSAVFSAAGFDGPDSVTVVLTARDQANNPVPGFQDTAIIDVLNRSPVITSGPPTTATAGQQYAYSVASIDPAGPLDPLVYFLDAAPAGMTINATTGLIEWTPPAAGDFNVALRVTDGDGGAASQNWAIQVVPSANSGGPYSVNEGATVPLAGTCVGCTQFNWDLDDDGTFETPGPNPVFSAATLDGPDQRTVRLEACDAAGNLCGESTAIVTVNNVAPTITTSPPTSGVANQQYLYQADASDPGGSQDPIVWNLVAGPTGMTVNPTTGRVVWTPALGGVASVTLRAADDDGGEATQSWNITIPGTVSAGGPYVVNEGGSVHLAATCVNCTSFRWDLDNNGTFETTGPNPIFSAAGLDGPGQQTVRLEGCISGLCSESTAQIDVRNVAPTITSNPITTGTAQQDYVYAAVATDPADVRDPLTWSLVSAPTGMTVDSATGRIEWTPTAPGSQDVTLRVSDGDGGVAQQTWQIAIIAQGTFVQDAYFFYNESAFDTGRAELLTIAGAEAGGHVKVFDASARSATSELASFFAYPGFTGGVRVATGDVNGDGIADVITAAGAGTPGGAVKVFDGDGGRLLRSFFAFPSSLSGVAVAAGDINGDGFADIITGSGPGAPGGHVKVFSGRDHSELWNYFFFDPAAGGVNVAAGDVNGDGRDDIIVGAGAGGGPHVKVFDGVTTDLLANFFAFDGVFTGGVFVAAGDVNGDGFDDIITGPGAGGGPHVRVFDGRTSSELSSFFAFDATFSGGVRVAAGDVNGDGMADIITGAGPGGGPHVKVFDGRSLDELQSFFAYDPAFTGGVFVASGDVDAGSASGDDLLAIDPNKKALRLGETATFRNVASYPLGLNGIGFNVLNLPAGGAGISVSDFHFRVGNDNFPDAWADGPKPTSMAVLPAAAGGGETNVVLAFENRAIFDMWLRVTILANANTGMAADQDFFFGHVTADAGAAFAGQGQFFGRDAADSSAIIASGLNRPASVGDPHDINRDGRVDVFDVQEIAVAGVRWNVILAITPQTGSPPVAAAVAPAVPLPLREKPSAGISAKDRIFTDIRRNWLAPASRESFAPLVNSARARPSTLATIEKSSDLSLGERGWAPTLWDSVLERWSHADFDLRSVV